MKLQDQVCTLEQAKRLKELGVTAEGYFCWGEKAKQLTEGWSIEGTEDRFYSGYTVAELMSILPSQVNQQDGIVYFRVEKNSDHYSEMDSWICGYHSGKQWKIGHGRESAASACADCLIGLLEANLITAEEVNKRLEG